MGKHSTLIIILFFSFARTFAQNVTVTGAITGNGSYNELNYAFSAINAGSQANANIVITISGNTTETLAAAILNQGSWTSLTIQPTGGAARTISGAFNQLIDLNGADNVTIDGLNSGGNSLTIDATSMSVDAAAIRFINDATNNMLTSCNLKGSSHGVSATANNGAVVWFANSPAGVSGNDNNTVSYCDIGPSGANLPYIGIRSFTDAFLPGKSNDNNIISNNTIHDFFSTTSLTATNGINIFNYNSNWTISNNKIYQTATRTFLLPQYEYRGIYINTSAASSGGGFTVTGNSVGYSSSLLTGNTIITGSSNIFNGISYTASATSALSSISNNTIAAINQTTSRSPTVGSGNGIQGFIGIGIFSGPATISNNIIGGTSGTGSIVIQTTQATLSTVNCISLILNQGSNNNTVSGNKIGAITISLNSGIASMSFTAIRNESTGAVIIFGNTIGNSTANNIISNQTQANIVGIQSTSSPVTISGNTIQNIAFTAANTGTGSSASILGIQNSATAISGDYISSNIISALKNSSLTLSAVEIRGIYWNSPSGSAPVTIEKNQISDFQIASSSASSLMAGITTINPAGSYNLYNNMISLGNSGAINTIIRGIFELGGTNVCYYNSVRIMGMANTGSAVSAAYYMSTGNTLTAKNNIFANVRNSISGNPKNYSIFFAGAFTYTGSNNNLYASGIAGVLGFNGSDKTTLAAWSSATVGAQDDPGAGSLSSVSQSVTFISVSDLHLDPASNCAFADKGTPVSILVDYDSDSRGSIAPDIGVDEFGIASWAGAISIDWNTAGNWVTGIVPTQYYDVIIPSGTTFSPSISSSDATCHSITIKSSASLTMSSDRTLTLIPFCTNSYFNNSGTFSAGSGNETVIFSGNGSVSGSLTFNNIYIAGSVDFEMQSSVNNFFRINSGGYVSSGHPLTYNTGSTLEYYTNGNYYRADEWSASGGPGYPYNVQLTNNTVLIPAGSGAAFAGQVFNLANNLTIDAGSSLFMDYSGNNMSVPLIAGNDITTNGNLSLSQAAGGDVKLNGNWVRASTGNFYPNCRGVFFLSTTQDQSVTITGGGTETFNYVVIDKSGMELLPGAGTDIKINATSGCGLGNDYLTISNGNIDLQGRTLYLEGPTGLTSGTNVMNLIVKNGTRFVLSSVAGGVVKTSSTLNSKTVLVKDGGGSGKILFGNDVEVQVANGEVDFGAGNLATINYIFRINSGGAVVSNAPYYAQNSKLIFSTGTVYDLVGSQQVWETGTLGTIAGVPWDVEVNLASTDVRVSDNLDRSVRNDFTILNGTFELGASPFLSGNLEVGGDWLRNSTGTGFVPNTNKVTFNSSINTSLQNQTITISGGGAETFYDLETDNGPGITLSSNANVTNTLYLTNGIVATGLYELYIQNTASAAISYDPSNNFASSWINGNLRRKIITGSYAFPVGSSNTTNSNGYELAFLNFNTNSNIDNILCKFTADATTTSNEGFSLVVNGTTILDRLDAGYWNFKPYDAALALIANPVCTYDVELNERGQTNSAGDPYYYSIIKRTDCFDPCAIPWNQQCGTHTNVTQTEPIIGETVHAERTGYGCSSFSDFAIGIGEFILPLTLIDFDVNSVGDDAFLNWNTESEYNSDYFSIERSLDGMHFGEIAILKAANFSTQPNHYSFTDKSISQLEVNKIFYRLRIVDSDNTFDYSAVRWIDLNDQVLFSGLNIFPNPFSDNFSINIVSAIDQNVLIQMTDVSGKVIFEEDALLSTGNNFISPKQQAELTTGMYFIKLYSGRILYASKIVKGKF